jgi:hypothetical protein
MHLTGDEVSGLSLSIRVAALAVAGYCAAGQSISLRPAERNSLPEIIDGNSPAIWVDGEYRLFHSTGMPVISRGSNQFSWNTTEEVTFQHEEHRPVWFEAAWQDDDGTVFLWYHNEEGGRCGDNPLQVPRIGAAISYDGGLTVHDLGIVLESGEAPNCEARNGFFAGGHGDFTVIPDRERNYFYFFFTNYGGPVEEQGVVVARMAFESRTQPAGAVFKYYGGEWAEPGIGGHMTPIFPAARAWEREDTDSLWGPAIHWNTHLEKYVLLMNRACCMEGWPQAGIHYSFNDDLSRPEGWRPAKRILSRSDLGFSPGWYPQVLGIEPGETDRVAGQIARLYVHGTSLWEVVFSTEDAEPEPEPEPCPESGICGSLPSPLW